jgi:hypothetical protein
VRSAIVIAACTVVTACGKFQDPNIVVDLRVIAMTASVPEQVLDVDFTHPPMPQELLKQVVPSEVCALVADPSFDGRRLRWAMTMCPGASDDRCDPDHPEVPIGSGIIRDPDLAMPEPRMCATIQPDLDLATVVGDGLDNDTLHGLQGLEYMVVLTVGGEDADPALDLYAEKALQVAARVPADRTPNHNPTLTQISASVAGADAVALPIGRCVDQPYPLKVMSGTKVRLTPIEPDGVRETYTIPLLDGTFQTFTENLTYEWSAAEGSFSDGTTGGPHDPFGNTPPLFTDWKAPQVTAVTDVAFWLVQRDERLGAKWYESCRTTTESCPCSCSCSRSCSAARAGRGRARRGVSVRRDRSQRGRSTRPARSPSRGHAAGYRERARSHRRDHARGRPQPRRLPACAPDHAREHDRAPARHRLVRDREARADRQPHGRRLPGRGDRPRGVPAVHRGGEARGQLPAECGPGRWTVNVRVNRMRRTGLAHGPRRAAA